VKNAKTLIKTAEWELVTKEHSRLMIEVTENLLDGVLG